MKKWVMMLCAVAALGLIACASAKKGQSPEKHTIVQKDNPAFTAADALMSFRYERVDVTGKESTTAVYQVSSNNFGGYLYYRNLGSNTGWSYVVKGEKEPLRKLAQCAAKHHIAQEPFTPLDNEDKSRTRWMVRMVTTQGDTISVVHYPEAGRTDADNQLDADILAIIKPYIAEATKEGNHGEYSRYVYSNGVLSRRIDYTRDNIVHGGWDANKPYATF